MKNEQVAGALRDIGFLTEVEDGPNAQFKSRAYYRAADAVEGLDEGVSAIYEKGGIDALLEIPGAGKAIAAKIEEHVKTGKIRYHEELRAKFPIDTAQLRIEGVGPKTLKAIYEKLKITNLAELEVAAREGRLKTVPGISAKKEQDIIKRIEFAKKGGGRHIIGEVWPMIKQIESRLKGMPGVADASVAGSVRRMKETIGDLRKIKNHQPRRT